MSEWIRACAASDVDEEDLIGFEHNGRIYCIYNTEKGFFTSDGMCTHEDEELEYGLVIGTVVECPLHQGRFDICTGRALGAPVSEDLKTYPTKVENGYVFVQLG